MTLNPANRLLSVEEIIARLEPPKVINAIDRRLQETAKTIVNEIMEVGAPTLWASLPDQAKNVVYGNIEDDIPYAVKKIFSEKIGFPF